MAEREIMRAQAPLFLEHLEFWGGEIREVYKENLAREFENVSPDAQTRVERIGAKLAVLNDLLKDLTDIVGNQEYAARADSKEADP